MPQVVQGHTRTVYVSTAELTRLIQAELASPAYRPPLLPAVAMELMELAQTPEVPLAELVKVLEKDPVLAARVLAIAQSAHYARRSPVTSLRQAAVRLGIEALTQLVLQAALELKVFRAPGFEAFTARLNRHATASAHVTRLVCKRAGLFGEQAFTCGLLHDIGYSAALLIAAEHERTRGLPLATLAPVLDAVHADASGLLARRWKLPSPIPEVVASHHEVVVDGTPRPLNAALLVAEQLCWEAGAGILPPPGDADPGALETPEQPLDGIDTSWASAVAKALEVVGLDARALQAARAEAFALVEELGLGERVA
jgi:HD-like signal output (HDOD) protein